MSQEAFDSVEPRRIILTGFMGSGKTTVGRVLAAQLGWRFADLDDIVADREGASVPEIFARHGEAFFRALEVEALESLLHTTELVVALGGGAVETPSLRELLAGSRDTRTVYLDAPFDVLYERCVRQALDPGATGRPLLGSRQAAAERHARRQAVYATVGQTHVTAALPTPAAVADAIVKAIAIQVPRR